MCGRTAMTIDPHELLNKTNAKEFKDVSRYRTSYNVAPTRYQPILLKARPPFFNLYHTNNTQDDDGENDQYHENVINNASYRILQSMKWGLVPYWTKHHPPASMIANTINARDDSVIQGKKLWVRPRETNRCIVPVQGFYEWKHLTKGSKHQKQPYYITREDNELIYMAGLYDQARITLDNGEKEDLYTYTIVTTMASTKMLFLHDRMPLILTKEVDIEMWLDNKFTFDHNLRNLLKPNDEGLIMYPVSSFVSTVGNDSPKCIEELNLENTGIQKYLIKKKEREHFVKTKQPVKSSSASSPSHTTNISSQYYTTNEDHTLASDTYNSHEHEFNHDNFDTTSSTLNLNSEHAGSLSTTITTTSTTTTSTKRPYALLNLQPGEEGEWQNMNDAIRESLASYNKKRSKWGEQFDSNDKPSEHQNSSSFNTPTTNPKNRSFLTPSIFSATLKSKYGSGRRSNTTTTPLSTKSKKSTTTSSKDNKKDGTQLPVTAFFK